VQDALGNPQSVLVLGGSSEIALATVRRLVADRCRTVVLAARNPGALEPVRDELARSGATVDLVAWDATEPERQEEILSGVFDAHRDIDLVIAAAAVLGNQDDYDADPVAAANAVATNFGGMVAALTVVAARMRAQGHGTIVVLSSVAGERVRASNAVYGATKAGLDAYAQALGDRLVGTGVRVMIVRPGFVHTRMTEGIEPAPFATTPDAVAADICAGLQRGSPVVWSPRILRWLFVVLRHLPRPLWRRVAAS
jgi:decaprenylphospho-beta-D-erythro-pentofuranosid-2-ulose 2-reductase